MAAAMSKATVYLEGPKRTQDLLNIKWALRSAGYTISSSWHDADPTPQIRAEDHWNSKSVERIQGCDWLVVICDKDNEVGMELASLAGFAIARGMRVTWIGSEVRSLAGFRAVQQFDTAEEFRKNILTQMYLRPALASTSERVAA